MIFKEHKYQYVIFYIYPFLISIGLTYFSNMNSTFIEQENVVLSIMLSALLTIMGILVSKNYDTKDPDVKARINGVLYETNNAIIFSVVLGIILMILNLIFCSTNITNNHINKIIVGCNYYLFIVMLLTILFIIKRLGNLLDVV